MRKLLMLIGALIMSNAYGNELVWWLTGGSIPYNTGTCTNGANITKPTNPSKSGYRFIGWREATDTEIAEFANSSGTSYSPTGPSDSTTWTVTFPYGTVSGEARYSSTAGSCGTSFINCSTHDNPSTSGTLRYCWCKMTSFAGKNISSPRWVFNSDGQSLSNQRYCVYNCVLRVRGNNTAQDWRWKLYGILQ